MRGSIRYYTNILKDKLTRVDEEVDNPEVVKELLEECNCLVELGNHFFLSNKTMRDGAEEFFEQKRCLRAYQKDKLSNKEDRKTLQTKPLLGNKDIVQSARLSEGTLATFHKNLAIEGIRDKIDEISDLNTYINSMVGIQSDSIDNIAHQMQSNRESSRSTVVQLENALRHRQNRNRIYNFVLVVIFFLVVAFLTFRVVLRI